MTTDSRLNGKKGLIVGIANRDSIAFGCARAFQTAGARLAITYLNEKAAPHVVPLAQELGAEIVLPLDLRDAHTLAQVFAEISRVWGELDFLLHSVAFAPKDDLHRPLWQASREGFLTAMDTSCHSFLRLAGCAVPLMGGGGSLITVSYLGAERVVPHYNLMGPVKAALEAVVRYAAAELGPRGIRVNALSPGPIPTRAAGGLEDFDALLAEAREKAPTHHTVTLDEIGAYASFLVGDGATNVTGGIHYIDGGQHIMA